MKDKMSILAEKQRRENLQRKPIKGWEAIYRETNGTFIVLGENNSLPILKSLFGPPSQVLQYKSIR